MTIRWQELSKPTECNLSRKTALYSRWVSEHDGFKGSSLAFQRPWPGRHGRFSTGMVSYRSCLLQLFSCKTKDTAIPTTTNKNKTHLSAKVRSSGGHCAHFPAPFCALCSPGRGLSFPPPTGQEGSRNTSLLLNQPASFGTRFRKFKLNSSGVISNRSRRWSFYLSSFHF